MGGDTGGNDCVHVADVGAVPGFSVAVAGRPLLDLRPETDVVLWDEHGNVCQYTYDEWHAFTLKIKRGEFAHIGGVLAETDWLAQSSQPLDAPHIADGAHADYLADPAVSGCRACYAEAVSVMTTDPHSCGRRQYLADPEGVDPDEDPKYAQARADLAAGRMEWEERS